MNDQIYGTNNTKYGQCRIKDKSSKSAIQIKVMRFYVSDAYISTIKYIACGQATNTRRKTSQKLLIFLRFFFSLSNFRKDLFSKIMSTQQIVEKILYILFFNYFPALRFHQTYSVEQIANNSHDHTTIFLLQNLIKIKQLILTIARNFLSAA